MRTLPKLSDLNILQGNLLECFSLPKDSKRDESSLVANISGTRLYNKSKWGWGTLWCWFYKITDLVDAEIPLNRIERAIKKTDQIFSKNLDNILSYHQQYENNLEGLEAKTPETSSHIARRARLNAARGIVAWNRAIKPLIGVQEELPIAKKAHLPETQANLVKGVALELLIKNQGKLTHPVPLNEIKKIAKREMYKTSEWDKVDKWIKLIEAENHSLTSGELHQTLQGYVGVFSPNASLGRLEATLISMRCLKLTHSDPKLEKWKRDLKEGMLFSRGKDNPPIQLGSQILSIEEKESVGSQKFFEVKDEPDLMFLTSRYHAEFGIRKEMLQSEEMRKYEAKIFHTDPEKRFVLMERLIPWSSFEWGDAPDPIEENIITFMKKQIEENKYFSHLESESWMFSKKTNQLNCTRYVFYRNAPFPLDLRDFAMYVAQNDHARYLRLIENSGLAQAFEPFTQALFENALSLNSHPSELMDKYKKTNPQMDTLKEGTLKYFNAFIAEVQKRYWTFQKKFPNISKEQLSKTMIDVYKEQKGLGAFWKTFDQEVLQRLSSKKI